MKHFDKHMLIWMRLMRVSHKARQAANAYMGSLGISSAQFNLLEHIQQDEGQPQGVIGQRLDVTKGNMSQMLKVLEREGLVERRSEGRTNLLYLTEAGADLLATVEGEHRAFIANMLADFTEEEVTTLTRLLRKLDHGLD